MKTPKLPLLTLSCLFLAGCALSPATSSASSSSIPDISTDAPVSSVPTEASQTAISEDSLDESIPVYPAPNLPKVSVKDLPAKSRTFYQLLVYSFADGNGDGIGDFKGIIDHLDYLESLGIGGLWLSPIHKADSYHAYDVIDYYSVNPRYEVTVNNKEYNLQALLDACHQRGIKVLLDLVLNHSSPNCAWYKEHRDWYSGIDAFSGGMKDFNFDNQSLRNELKNVGKYWLNQGVDGFRLDAAKWVYNEGEVDRSNVDDAKNFAWWKEFYGACKDVKSDVYMIGEVLSNATDVVSYYQSGLDGDFNFTMRDKIFEAVHYGRPSSYSSFVESFQKSIRAHNLNGIESSVLSNHDIGRYQNYNKSGLGGAKLALAGILNILAPGDSYVYYGEEVGMDGRCSGTSESFYNDLNFRTPMPFASGKTNPANYLYSSVPSKSMTSTTYKDEAVETSSFREVYRKAIEAKNRASVLYEGTAKALGNGGDSSVASFACEKGDKKATVIVNVSASWKKGTLSGATGILGECSLKGVGHYEDGPFLLAPYGALILDGEASIASIRSIEDGTPVPVEPDIDAFGQEVFSEVEGSLTLHMKNVNNWSKASCYAWVGNKQYLGGWPGKAMDKDGEWFTVSIPHGASNIIFNDGTNQTVNLYRPVEGEYWFIPEKGSGKTISGNWYRHIA